MLLEDPASEETLKRAHLALVRKDYYAARELLEPLIEAEPDNKEAQELLDRVAEAQVQATIEEERERNWIDGLDLSQGQIVALFALGIVCVLGAIVWAIPAIQESSLHAQAAVTRRGTDISLEDPFHLLLLKPMVAFLVGVVSLFVAYRASRQ